MVWLRPSGVRMQLKHILLTSYCAPKSSIKEKHYFRHSQFVFVLREIKNESFRRVLSAILFIRCRNIAKY
jgi:hypothetical protein